MSEPCFEQADWSLEGLLPAHQGPKLEGYLAELEDRVTRFESARQSLSPDIDAHAFLDLLDQYETIYAELGRLRGYAYLWLSGDTQDQEALGFLGWVDRLSAEIGNRILFFSLWWKGLDAEVAGRLIAVSGDYAYYLESLRRYKPYTLSEAEEKIINLKDVTGANALINLYEMITNRFSFQLEVNGEVQTLTRDELALYIRHPSREVRAAAYQEMFRVYANQAVVLGQVYSNLVRDWASENVTLRGYDAAISVRNLANDIPDPVVDTLLSVCRENMPVFHHYFELKARSLDISHLRRYDVYAPLGTVDKSYPFSEATGMVLDSLERFSPVMAGHARRILAAGHVSSVTRPGKRGGAFCYSPLPGLTPWVLVNYVGKIDDVLTLAHELGHGVHGLMAADHSFLTFHSSLPLAETASVFSEMLLVDRLLAEERDPLIRRDLLVTVLDAAYATIARQAYFVLFEVEAHRRVVEGATIEELCLAYQDNLQEQFGGAVELTDDFRWEWVAIPHIYASPFYCYAYSFGQLLVLALYQQYKEEGASFTPRLLKILAYGGSMGPVEIISEAGFDVAAPEFWQAGFDFLQSLVEELEALQSTGGRPVQGGERA